MNVSRTVLENNEQLEVWWPRGRPLHMKSSSKFIYTSPDKTVQWTSVRAADEVTLCPKNNPADFKLQLQRSSLCFTHSYDSRAVVIRGQAPRSEIKLEGEIRKRSRNNRVGDHREPRKTLLCCRCYHSLRETASKSYEVLFRAKYHGWKKKNQTINRLPTEINSTLSGSLSWHILEKCLPLLSQKLLFLPNLSPDRDHTHILKSNSTSEGFEYAIILSQESNIGASSLQNTPPRMAGMSRNNQIRAVLTFLI